MKAGQRPIAILFGLDAMQVVRSGSADAPLLLPYPQDLDLASPGDFGTWLRSELSKNQVTQRSVVVVVQRREITTRLIRFDTVLDASHDLPGMVRLQMEDQATTSHDAVVDFARFDQAQGKGRAAAESVEVFAAAMPSVRVESLKRIVDAAGLRLRAITPLGLSVQGAVGGDAAKLVVSQSLGGIDVVFTRGGGDPVRHTWIAIASSVHDADAMGDAFQRMLLMQHLDPGDMPHEAVVVASDPEDSATLADVLTETSRIVSAATSVNQSSLAIAAANPIIDFLNPTSPPDRAAKQRQVVMALLLLVILLVGAGFTLARGAVQRLEQNTAILKEQLAESEGKRVERVRQEVVLQHTSRWLDAGLNPSAELARITQRLPSHQQVFLRELAMVVDAEVRYERERRERRYDPGRWEERSALRVNVRGAAVSQQVIYQAWQALLAPGDLSLQPLAADGTGTSIEGYPSKFEVRVDAAPMKSERGEASE